MSEPRVDEQWPENAYDDAEPDVPEEDVLAEIAAWEARQDD